MGEVWLDEPEDGAVVVVWYSVGMRLTAERDDSSARGARRWWCDQGANTSGPHAWAQVLDGARCVYRLELLAEAPDV